MEFYNHWLLFVEAVTLAGDYSISADDELRVKKLLNQFFVDYERLYYRYDFKRVGACKPTFHALLHVGDYISELGMQSARARIS